jgi:hypothetical protein
VNKKVMILTIAFLAVIMLTPALSTVQACGWRRNKPNVEFVFHIENVVRVDDNVRWWFDTGDSGTGTPPQVPPEGALKSVQRGFQFVLLGEGTYLQIDETVIPIAPEEYSCDYDVYVDYDVALPVVCELKYFTRETITFNTAEFKGFLKIFAVEDGTIIVNPDSPLGFDMEVSGVCFGYGRINGKTVTIRGERNLLEIVPSTVVENSGMMKFFRW